MPASDFLSLLRNAPRPLLADGAMGTMLHSRGVGFQQCFDGLNLSDPGLVTAIHREYIAAGAQIVLTNTFGANRFKLAEHGLSGSLEAINHAGVALARKAASQTDRPVLVAGDVGPLGVRLAPFGRVSPEQAQAVFTAQIGALAEAGADLILIETLSDLAEARAALSAARQVCSLPVVVSMTFTRDDRTLLGDDPVQVARALAEAGPDVVGVNCSGGPAQILRLLDEMRSAVPDLVYAVKPNAGFPEQVGGRIMYPATAAYFADYTRAFWQAGARVIGGCCGTTPEHVHAMLAALQEPPTTISVGRARRPPEPEAAEEETPEATCQLARRLAEGQFTVAIEMQPPRGLATHKLLAGASLLAEAGAHVINVADSPMARMRMSPWAVCSLIQNTLQVETTLHFPTRGRNLLRVQGDLLAAHALGVRNVFVVMGDPTSIGDYPDAMDDYDLVPSGLIRLIKQGFNAGVDHAGASIGAPTAFYVGAALNLNPSDPDREMRATRRKLACGVDFFLTQPTYQPEPALAFLDRYEAAHGPLDKPILMGVLPLYNPRHAAFLHNEVPGIHIPAQAIQRLEAAGDHAPREGVQLALELIDSARARIAGVYLIPAFSRYDLAAEIIESLPLNEKGGGEAAPQNSSPSR